MAFTIGFHHDVPGDTGLSVELYPLDSGAIANGAGGDSLVEQTAGGAEGYYEAAVAESLSGIHRAFIVKGGERLASGAVNITGTGTYQVGDAEQDVATLAMPESYAANGVEMTPQQALYAIHQLLAEFAISGTSKTVKQLDGTTEAFVVTLDDDESPTSLTRNPA